MGRTITYINIKFSQEDGSHLRTLICEKRQPQRRTNTINRTIIEGYFEGSEKILQDEVRFYVLIPMHGLKFKERITAMAVEGEGVFYYIDGIPITHQQAIEKIKPLVRFADGGGASENVDVDFRPYEPVSLARNCLKGWKPDLSDFNRFRSNWKRISYEEVGHDLFYPRSHDSVDVSSE
jgi:hypothetical protein